MKWTFETALSAEECLALLQDTPSAYGSYQVRIYGKSFRIWRERSAMEQLGKRYTIDPSLDGLLTAIPTGTQIQCSIGNDGDCWVLGIAPLLGVLGAVGACGFAALQTTKQQTVLYCLTAIALLVIGLVGTVFIYSAMSGGAPADKNDLVEFVSLTLRAKPTSNKTFAKPQIVTSKKI